MSESTRLYNTKTGRAEKLPADQIESAILSGSHAYKKGDRVDVVKDGQSYNVDSSELGLVLQDGYRLERPQEKAVRDYVKENSGIKGVAKTFTAQMVDEALMGVPEMIYDHNADPLDVAKKEALKRENAIANTLGGGIGFVGSLLYGGPVGKAAVASEKLGVKASEIFAKRLAGLGVGRGSESVAKDILARSATNAVKLGVEGGANVAPVAITEAALGDPDQAAETVMAGMGVGGVLGIASGPLGPVFEKVAKSRAQKKELEAALKEAAEKSPLSTASKAEEIGPIFDPGQIEASLPEAPLGAEDLRVKNLGGRSGAAKAAEAAKRQGINLYDTVLSESELSRNAGEALRREPSMAGQAFQKRAEETYGDIQRVMSNTLGKTADDAAVAELSKVQVGENIAEAMVKKIEGVAKYFDEKYGAIKSAVGDAAFEDETLLKAFDAAKKTKGYEELSVLGQTNQVDNLLDSALRAKNQSGLDTVITAAGNAAEGAKRSGNYALANAMSDARTILKKAREEGVEKFTAGIIPGEAGAAMNAERRALDSEYRAMKDYLKELGVSARIGKNKTLGSIRNAVMESVQTNPEKFYDSLFNPKKGRVLQFFKREFPDAFEEARKFKLSEIAKQNSKDGRYNVNGVLRWVKGLSKEAKEELFSPAQRQALEDLRLIQDALPKNPNPSGTAYTQQLQSWLNPMALPENIAREASGWLKYHALTNEVANSGLVAAEKAMKRVGEKLSNIPEAISGVSSGSAKSRPTRSTFRPSMKDLKKSTAMLATLAGAAGAMTREKEPKTREEAFERVEKILDAKRMSPSSSDRSAQVFEILNDGGAPQVANSYAAASQRMVEYLSSQIPRSTRPADLLIGRRFIPSDAELAAFERKLEVSEDPTAVIEHLKNGSLTRDHVEALENVYPKLYGQIKSRIMNHIADSGEKFPYQSRLKLSLLFQEDWDPSLYSVGDYQKSFLAPDAQTAPKKFDMENNLASEVQALETRKT